LEAFEMRSFETLGLCALLGSTMVTGCAGSTFLYNHRVENSYSPARFGVAAGRKDLETVVSGDPFGMGQERFAAATLAVLNRHEPWPQPTNFTLEPGESANRAYRVVLVFDAPGVSTIRICQETAPRATQEAETDGALHVAAAFCLNRGEMTAVKGKVADVEGIDDPRFDRLLGQVVLALFPPFDPNEDDEEILLISRR
jgi:hypothetical protein